MSEKEIVIAMIVVSLLMGICLGVGIGNWATRRLLEAKVQEAIERAHKEASVRVFTSAGVNGIPTITCTTGMTPSGTGIIWSDSHE